MQFLRKIDLLSFLKFSDNRASFCKKCGGLEKFASEIHLKCLEKTEKSEMFCFSGKVESSAETREARKTLRKAALIAKIGVDSAESEPRNLQACLGTARRRAA